MAEQWTGCATSRRLDFGTDQTSVWSTDSFSGFGCLCMFCKRSHDTGIIRSLMFSFKDIK